MPCGVHREVSLVSGQVWTVSGVCTNTTAGRKQEYVLNNAYTLGQQGRTEQVSFPKQELQSTFKQEYHRGPLLTRGCVLFSSSLPICSYPCSQLMRWLMTAAAGQRHGARARQGSHSQGAERASAVGSSGCGSEPPAVTPAAGSAHRRALQTPCFTKRSDLLPVSVLKTQKNGLWTDNFSWIFQINLLSCSYAIILIAKLIATLPTVLFCAD